MQTHNPLHTTVLTLRGRQEAVRVTEVLVQELEPVLYNSYLDKQTLQVVPCGEYCVVYL